MSSSPAIEQLDYAEIDPLIHTFVRRHPGRPARLDALEKLAVHIDSSPEVYAALLVVDEQTTDPMIAEAVAAKLAGAQQPTWSERKPELVAAYKEAMQRRSQLRGTHPSWARGWYCPTCRKVLPGRTENGMCDSSHDIAYSMLTARGGANGPRLLYLAIWGALAAVGFTLADIWDPFAWVGAAGAVVLGAYVLVAVFRDNGFAWLFANQELEGWPDWAVEKQSFGVRLGEEAVESIGIILSAAAIIAIGALLNWLCG